MAVIVGTGLTQSFVLVRHVHNLLHTAYGQAVLVKLGLLCGILALGGFNRPACRAEAAAAGRAGRSTGTHRPAASARDSPRSARRRRSSRRRGRTRGFRSVDRVELGPLRHHGQARTCPELPDLTVDPSRTGRNVVHVYLLNPTDGTQYDRVKDLRLSWSLPSKDIGAIELAGRRAGPGHYVVDNALLGVAGTWTLTVTARVSDFDEYTTDLRVPIH